MPEMPALDPIVMVGATRAIERHMENLRALMLILIRPYDAGHLAASKE